MPADREELTACARYFPLVGAVLGLALALPLYAGIFSAHPLAGGWFYVLFSAFLTRGLHYDGLADLADALGSGKEGDDFWKVIKDSRLGAFGGLALALAVGGLALLVSILLTTAPAPGTDAQPRYALLVLAPTLGRCLPAILAWRVPARPSSREAGLGGLLAPVENACQPIPVVPLVVLAAGSLLCLPFPRALLCWVLCLAVLRGLARIARTHGGFNGDFLGAAIILGELSVCLAACA